MRKLIIPATLAAILVAPALSFAAAVEHSSGTVKAFNAKEHSLTLADGSVYAVPKTFKDPGLKAGEKVSIDWAMQGKTKMVDHISIEK
jgi:hypothetical protein